MNDRVFENNQEDVLETVALGCLYQHEMFVKRNIAPSKKMFTKKIRKSISIISHGLGSIIGARIGLELPKMQIYVEHFLGESYLERMVILCFCVKHRQMTLDVYKRNFLVKYTIV